ncbi:MAG: electron transport complex subunit RsxB [Burkholderiaceae bacterium]|nr:electron transport complex subunit RsxB [Burkholderiaceae bacterium]
MNQQQISLANQLEDALPQTQCTKCGFPSCRAYAEAIALGQANYNQCPPGGAVGVARLAAILTRPRIALNIEHGNERPRPVALIDEAQCIGCTLCIQACPVDAILGAAKQMHTVISALCTGCDLCVAPCPVDCISMVNVTGEKTGWDAWSQAQADQARKQFHARNARLLREKKENDERLLAKAKEKLRAIAGENPLTKEQIDENARKKAIIAAAIARASANKP